jgi:hypothetical protein
MAKVRASKKPVDDLEERFWGNCCSSIGEELKQVIYMKWMGFPAVATWQSPINYDFGGRSVIDIGGGPCSVLLKGINVKQRPLVVDPGNYPDWVWNRYDSAGIRFWGGSGENLNLANLAPVDPPLGSDLFDLALIYNCLQHCVSPKKVIANARAVAKDLKMFEWINIPPHEGHPHELKADDLDRWTGRTGTVVQLNGENGCFGAAWVLA